VRAALCGCALNAGGAYNVGGFGLPRRDSRWRPGMDGQPTLNLDAGRYLSGDVNKFVTGHDATAPRAARPHTTPSPRARSPGVRVAVLVQLLPARRPDLRDQHPVRRSLTALANAISALRAPPRRLGTRISVALAPCATSDSTSSFTELGET